MMFWALAMTASAQNSYTDLVRQGTDALAADSLQKAELLFRQAMSEYPQLKTNALLFQHIAHIKEAQGKYMEALENYSMGLNLSPTTMGLLMDRASLYMRLDNRDRALVDYSDVLDLNPDHTEALFFRAYIYSQRHDYKNARQDYERLLKLEPTNEEAQVGLILVNDNDNRHHEAMEQIDALIHLKPDHAILYAVRGGMRQQRKDYEMALRDLNKAIELDEQNPDYYVSRALLYLDMGKRKYARQDGRTAISLGADANGLTYLFQ